MVQIKPYNEKYREDVHLVCMNTGPVKSFSDEKVRQALFAAYCDYYIENEPQNCFVLTDENDVAQGYVLCAENQKEYSKGFKPYLKKLKKLGLDHWTEAKGESMCYSLFANSAPAHLHIDINEGFRGSGNGTRMLETLFEHLKSKGVCGVMLIVGAFNEGAIKFYKKNGFKAMMSMASGVVMIKEL